jgi:hypothetical protein
MAVEQRTTEAFKQVEGGREDLTFPEMLRFQCPCGHVIKKRKDSFLPGAHMLTCTVCHNSSSEIHMLNGEILGVRSKNSHGEVG